MSKKLQCTLPDRYHAVLTEAAEVADVSKSELIRDWIRDMPEWKTVKSWGGDSPVQDEGNFDDF